MRSNSFCFSTAFPWIFLLSVITVSQRRGDHLFVFPLLQLVGVNGHGKIVQQGLSDGILSRGHTELDELQLAFKSSPSRPLSLRFLSA